MPETEITPPTRSMRAWILPGGRIELLPDNETHGNAVTRLLGKSTRKSFDPFASGWIRISGDIIETGDLHNPQMDLAFAEFARRSNGPAMVTHPGGNIEVPLPMADLFLVNARAGKYDRR